MSIYFTSDQHYFHKNIIKYCNRPFVSVDNMNADMTRKYNHIIDDDDIVIHIGDISAGLKDKKDELKEICKNLKGKKYLIRGNHDHLTDEEYLAMGFIGVSSYLIMEDYFICHYPLIPETKYTTKAELELIKAYKESKCTKLIHGHSHSIDFGNHKYNVCVDLNGFMPLSFDYIKDQLALNRKEKRL